jgi:hypothetical protein
MEPMRMSLRIPLLPAVAVAALVLAPVAPGAVAQAGETLSRQVTGTAGFSDRELRQFADAAIEVQRIGVLYAERFLQAASDQERTAIELEAMQEMAKAVNRSGLSVAMYQQIYRAAQFDPRIARRIGEHVGVLL